MALANHNSFENKGYVISALFDNDPQKIGTKVNEKPVLDIATVNEYIKENNISIAILTLPKIKVNEMIDDLADAGIKGIWNFTSAVIRTDKKIVTQKVHMSDSLMTLSCMMAQSENE